jgi:hypothetical protein
LQASFGALVNRYVLANIDVLNGSILFAGGYYPVTSSIVPLDGGWKISISGATLTGVITSDPLFVPSIDPFPNAWGATSGVGDGVSGVLIRDVQLELGNAATAYQKVTDPWDVTEAGKRDCYCLYGDGIDDTMATTGNVLPVRNGLSVVGAFGHVSTGSSANQDALFGLSNLSTTYFTLRSRRQAAVRQAAAAVQNAAGAFGQTTALGDAGFDFGRPIVISATQNADALSVTTKNPDSSASGAATLDSTVSASVPIRVFPVANSSPVRWYGGIVIDRPLTDLECAFAMEHFGYLSGAIE